MCSLSKTRVREWGTQGKFIEQPQRPGVDLRNREITGVHKPWSKWTNPWSFSHIYICLPFTIETKNSKVHPSSKVINISEILKIVRTGLHLNRSQCCDCFPHSQCDDLPLRTLITPWGTINRLWESKSLSCEADCGQQRPLSRKENLVKWSHFSYTDSTDHREQTRKKPGVHDLNWILSVM